MKFLVFIFLIVPWLIPSAATAQGEFSDIKLTMTANRLMSGNTLLKSWNSTPGLGFEIGVPYHVGNIETGFRYVRFNEMRYEDSGFNSYYIFIGWNYEYKASQELSIAGGFRLGKHLMYHDEDMIYGGEYVFSRQESEFAYEIQFRLQYEISRHFEFYFAPAYNRTVFQIPFSAWYGTVGVTVKFESPNWVKRLIQ